MSLDELPEDEFGTDDQDETSERIRDHMIHQYFAVSAIAMGAAIYYLETGLPPGSSYVDELQTISSIGLVSLGMFPDGIKSGFTNIPSKSAALIGGALIGYGHSTNKPELAIAGMIIAGTGVITYLQLIRKTLLRESNIISDS